RMSMNWVADAPFMAIYCEPPAAEPSADAVTLVPAKLKVRLAILISVRRQQPRADNGAAGSHYPFATLNQRQKLVKLTVHIPRFTANLITPITDVPGCTALDTRSSRSLPLRILDEKISTVVASHQGRFKKLALTRLLRIIARLTCHMLRK